MCHSSTSLSHTMSAASSSSDTELIDNQECPTCGKAHGTSELAQRSASNIRDFLSQIQALDQTRVRSTTTTKCELVEILHDPQTQCLRLCEKARFPKSRSPPFVSGVKRRRNAAGRAFDHGFHPVQMASKMVQDAEFCLAALKQHASFGCEWLEQLKPDWSSSLALLRSVYMTQTDPTAMSWLSALTGSSTHSFCILVTLMRAMKLNDWTAACKMWAFDPHNVTHPIVGGTPEILLNMNDLIWRSHDVMRRSHAVIKHSEELLNRLQFDDVTTDSSSSLSDSSSVAGCCHMDVAQPWQLETKQQVTLSVLPAERVRLQYSCKRARRTISDDICKQGAVSGNDDSVWVNWGGWVHAAPNANVNTQPN